VATGLTAATFVFYSERVPCMTLSDEKSDKRTTETDPRLS